MKNVKDVVYEKLSSVVSNTTDTYPSDWSNLPAVQYVEEENKVYERTENEECKSYVRYAIDIWHSVSTSETALLVDKAVSTLGLVRTSCKDVPEPSGLKHKHMVYEGIIDMKTEIVYWNN